MDASAVKTFFGTLFLQISPIVCFQGYVEVFAEQRLRVLYLPGVPEAFEKQVQLKVASLPAQTITLTGEGVPPTVRLNLSHTLCTPQRT